MIDTAKLRQKAMSEGMKLMGNPKVMKFMSSPRGQKLMSLAFTLPQQIDGAIDVRAKKLAKLFRLATREEIKGLTATIRSLEQTLQTVQAKLDKSGAK